MFCLFRGIGEKKLASHLRFIVMRPTNIMKSSTVALRHATLLFGLSLCAGAAAADPREAGIWYDDTGKGAVKIEICTPTTLCGKIYWLKEPLNAKGTPKTDAYNPDPSLRSRPICGLPILGDLEQLSEGGFDNGWVYDPKEGKSYSVALELVASDKLQVTGYKGMKFLGKSFIWTRAPKDLPACATDAAAVPGKAGAEKVSTGSSGKTAAPASKLGASGVASDRKTKKVARTPTPQHPVASN
jgi:uncharacterized protein (DUF2147 family)